MYIILFYIISNWILRDILEKYIGIKKYKKKCDLYFASFNILFANSTISSTIACSY